MKTIDIILMSVRNLWRRKLRTFLTILGVVIGACSIILMLSLGIAMDRNFEEQISQMGNLTVITVSGGQNQDPKAPKLDDKAIESLSKRQYVERVIPSLMTNAYITYGKYRTNWDVMIYALDAEDMSALGYTAVQGRDMNQGEKNVMVLGGELPRQFTKIGKQPNWNKPPEALPINFETDKMQLEIAQFDYSNGKPLLENFEGEKIKAPKAIELKVVGVLSETNYEIAGNAYVPREIFDKLVEEKTKYEEKLYGKQNNNNRGRGYMTPAKGTYNELKIKVSDRDKVMEVQEAIKAEGYMAYSSMDWLTEMKKVSNGMQMALGGIGAISLLVAAIGIANTMMMSIYERTREIGIMKVIGAKLPDIKKMFLVEAIMIGGIGGLVGVIISSAVSLIVNTVGGGIANVIGMNGASKVSVIPPWLMIGAVVFSTVIGLVSGYFPAKRAMKLSALSAIKTE
jgi:ABC-type antimicrobial peptide transport system permease subunit